MEFITGLTDCRNYPLALMKINCLVFNTQPKKKKKTSAQTADKKTIIAKVNRASLKSWVNKLKKPVFLNKSGFWKKIKNKTGLKKKRIYESLKSRMTRIRNEIVFRKTGFFKKIGFLEKPGFWKKIIF